MPQTPFWQLPPAPASPLVAWPRLNAILLALQSANSGSAAPSNPVEGMFWRDTSNAANPVFRVYRLGSWVALLNDLGITATAAQINAAATQAGTNLIINGTGRINQRGYVSGTPLWAANEIDRFGFCRWRASVQGQSIGWTGTTAGGTFTAPAGGVAQTIEGANISGGTYCLSWIGTATATVNGLAVANGGTVTLTAGANATVRFTGGTFTQVQLELGTVPTPYQRLDISDELRMCERFFQSGQSYGWGYAPAPNLVRVASVYLRGQMRAAPSITFTAASGSNVTGQTAEFVTSASFGIFSTAPAAGLYSHQTTWTANAEITA